MDSGTRGGLKPGRSYGRDTECELGEGTGLYRLKH